MTLPFKAFDADNHYYEAEDAFIRHVDPRLHKRCMQWAQIDGRQRLLVGGRVNRFIPNPTFDPEQLEELKVVLLQSAGKEVGARELNENDNSVLNTNSADHAPAASGLVVGS